MIDNAHYKTISERPVRLLGHDLINQMLEPQIGHLTLALDRFVKKHGTAEAVTDMEIIGAYKLIVDHVCPAALVFAYETSATGAGQPAKPEAEGE